MAWKVLTDAVSVRIPKIPAGSATLARRPRRGREQERKGEVAHGDPSCEESLRRRRGRVKPPDRRDAAGRLRRGYSADSWREARRTSSAVSESRSCFSFFIRRRMSSRFRLER